MQYVGQFLDIIWTNIFSINGVLGVPFGVFLIGYMVIRFAIGKFIDYLHYNDNHEIGGKY